MLPADPRMRVHTSTTGCAAWIRFSSATAAQKAPVIPPAAAGTRDNAASTNQQHVMLLGFNAQIVVVAALPQLLHVVPVVDEALPDGVVELVRLGVQHRLHDRHTCVWRGA